ncbi:hypothetical protein C8R44DRAFT_974505 [Mycena epipterygia]|nr:hypothetical protein C8R44DRAFT_974505 [Mycena epipterygia]
MLRVEPFNLKYEEAAQNASENPELESDWTTTNIPSAPQPAPPLYDELEAVGLLLGPLVWDKDIAGQVRALFDIMPQR